MLVFYDKHYAAKYPRFIGSAMRLGIGLRRRQARRGLLKKLRAMNGGR
jgi:hypothetical protein